MPREQLVELLQGYEGILARTFNARMQAKLGLTAVRDGDASLLQELFDLMQANAVDYPRFFRKLCGFRPGARNDDIRDDIVDRDPGAIDRPFRAYASCEPTEGQWWPAPDCTPLQWATMQQKPNAVRVLTERGVGARCYQP